MAETPVCIECKVRECERFTDYEDGDYYDTRCSYCNDKQIAHANERADWHRWHGD